MTRFLKLTKLIINKNAIHHIVMTNEDKCIIHLIPNKIDGYSLWGTGRFSSYDITIEVCKTKHSTDYKIVTDWINNKLK